MADLRLNGISTGGNIYELQIPADKTLLDIKRAAENDGLDQVYFQVGETYYVAEGDGLNLSGLQKGVFQSVELIRHPGSPQEKAELGTLRVVDNEVNTAWEGVRHVGKASVALLTGGLIGGGAFAGKAVIQAAPAMGQMQQGMNAMKTGFTAVKAGMMPMNEGMQLSIGAVQKVIGSGQSTGVIGGILDGAKKVVDLPKHTRDMTTGLGLIKDGANTAQKGLFATEQGVAHFDKSMQIAKSSSSTLKKGAYAVGIGAAVAGTVAIGGAIYGATRKQNDQTLASFKQAALD